MRIISLVTLLLLSALPASAETVYGRATAIESGNTLSFKANDGRTFQVRLKGIDAPGMNQPFGPDSKKYLESLAQDDLTLETFKTDPRGRTIADLYTPALLVNQQMVKAGQAWWYRKYAPGDQILSAAEVEARQQQRGLWREQNPVAPWDWQKTHPAVSLGHTSIH
ncbi:MAG: thermonuclease family protein [Candidatus Obscuribacterales bacterium]|nr:thermonuclease family protein [Candidatus Obscuribacterales bacterium]